MCDKIWHVSLVANVSEYKMQLTVPKAGSAVRRGRTRRPAARPGRAWNERLMLRDRLAHDWCSTSRNCVVISYTIHCTAIVTLRHQFSSCIMPCSFIYLKFPYFLEQEIGEFQILKNIPKEVVSTIITTNVSVVFVLSQNSLTLKDVVQLQLTVTARP